MRHFQMSRKRARAAHHALCLVNSFVLDCLRLIFELLDMYIRAAFPDVAQARSRRVYHALSLVNTSALDYL